jgi:hypothetical protein
MPSEGETKPCSYPGCKGTLTYSAKARPPGWGAGTAGEGGQTVWGAQEQPGWECDKNRDHFKPAKSN